MMYGASSMQMAPLGVVRFMTRLRHGDWNTLISLGTEDTPPCLETNGGWGGDGGIMK